MIDPEEMYIEIEDELIAEFEEEHGRSPNDRELELIVLSIPDIVADRLGDLADHAYDSLRDG